jgi:homoserine kinase
VTAEVVVEVPATSANLGPGFDSLGLALGLADRIEARFVPGEDVVVDVRGHGAGSVPTGPENLVARVVRTGLVAFDESGDLARRGLALRCTNDVPHGRGLGSSAAAIVGALAVAAHLAGVADAVSPAELVALATRLEGHPDNVAPGVLGGATVAWMETGAMGPVGRAARLAVHPDLTPVLAIPDEECATAKARGALPVRVAHADAVFNVGRAALLVHALGTDPALLLEATDDRLHQPHRRTVYPAALGLVEALRAAGIPAAVSGAGPSVIAFAVGDPAPVVAGVAALAGPSWQVRALPVAPVGVHAL